MTSPIEEANYKRGRANHLPVFETVVIATDGSESVERAVAVAVDLAERFGATVHALSVVDIDDVEGAPESVREDFRSALAESAGEATEEIETEVENDVETAVREGRPAAEITSYAEEMDADVVAMGTRGRHGENRFLIGSVAERVVRTCPVPVMTVRQIDNPDDEAGAAERA
jgi:nucleotide-binding universal stress UspA family protein